MSELEAMLQDIAEMEEAIRELKQRIKNIPTKFAEQLGTQEERIEAACYLYWIIQKVPAQAIASDLLGVTEWKLRELVGRAKGLINCEKCGKPIEFRCREHKRKIIVAFKRKHSKYAKVYEIMCDKCWNEFQEIRNHKSEEYYTALQARLFELKIVPYQEYLQTSEWQERRKRHLESVDYRCQVCNATSKPIDIHHRTYERRGDERYTDLLALCRDCHALFHREGRLAN